MAPEEPAPIDLEAVGGLVAQSEIDFRSLIENIRSMLKERSQVSIGNILDRFLAAQGLGSVVGYLALASRHGVRLADRTETVAWRREDSLDRAARIPVLCFFEGEGR